MEDMEKSIWAKTQDELTVGEQYKLALGATAIVTAVSVAIWAAAVGGIYAWELRKERKAEKAMKDSEK